MKDTTKPTPDETPREISEQVLSLQEAPAAENSEDDVVGHGSSLASVNCIVEN